MFDYNKWKVDTIQDPNILLERLNGLNIKGAKIKSIRILGNIFCVGSLSHVDYDSYDEIDLDDDAELDRFIEIDEPIIFELEDGRKLEIDYSDGSSLKVGIDSIDDETINIEENMNYADIVFSNCLENRIMGFVVEMHNEPELVNFTGSYGMKLDPNKKSYISGLKILLDYDISIYFKNFFDYGHISVLKNNIEISKFKYKDIKERLKTKFFK